MMTMGFRYWLLVLFTCCPLLFTYAQKSDSVQRLREVVISSTRLESHSVGYRLEDVDAIAIENSAAANLDELLTWNTNAQIRSYGVNGLSTVNLRGTGSSHTAILWNGINIQSPTSGVLDVALLPVTFIDQVSVQFGGSGSLYGAGAVGGVVHLQNQPDFNKGLTLMTKQAIGSFGRHHQTYGLGWSDNRFSGNLKYFRYRADNDFNFINSTLAGRPEQSREHNGFSQEGFLAEGYYKVGTKDLVSLRFWVQDNQLDIPNPITVVAPGNAEQRDEFNHSVFSWEHEGQAYSSTFRSGLINHKTNFQDTLTGRASATTYHSLVNEFEISPRINSKTELNLGVNHTHEWIDSENHGTIGVNRDRTSAFLNYRQNLTTKLLLNLRARQEIVDGNLMPFTPSLGMEYFIIPGLQLKSSVSRSYLIPTFNQLYWSGAGGFGNLDLQTENSWSEELGMVWSNNTNSQLKYEIEVTAFSNQVDNWILWTPVTASEWSPSNIKKVWSRGFETSNKLETQLGRLNVRLQANYSYIKSTNQEVAPEGNPDEVGKQLIYTPEHTGKLMASISQKGYQLAWWYQITGRQYTTSDNSEIRPLRSFGVSNLSLSKDLEAGPFEFNAQFQINNLFNKSYLVRAGYPMPLRNIRFSLTAKF